MTCYDGNCKNCRRGSVCRSNTNHNNTNLSNYGMKEYSSPVLGIEIKFYDWRIL